MAVIELKDISHSYKNMYREDQVLKNINLSLQEGKIYAIKGASGSGKSTLINIIGGLLLPTQGQVLLNGNDITKYSESNRANLRISKISYIFQNFNLLSYLNVEENIFLPIRVAKRKVNDYKLKYKDMLSELQITGKEKSYIQQLSGGEQQRVAIVRSLLSNPKVILADEPTGSLDSKNANIFMNMLIKTVEKNKVTAIVVTHSDVIANYCDHCIEISDGQIMNQAIS